jgi:hypothetical protein
VRFCWRLQLHHKQGGKLLNRTQRLDVSPDIIEASDYDIAGHVICGSTMLVLALLPDEQSPHFRRCRNRNMVGIQRFKDENCVCCR